METVSFTRKGVIDHADSFGGTGRYGQGDVQWMTAGSGIQHAEMYPLLDETGPNPLDFFQIWLNLPAADKLADPHLKMFWREELPTTILKDDAGHSTEVTVVAGVFHDIQPLTPPPTSWAARSDAELAIWQFVAEPTSQSSLPPTLHRQTVRTLYVFDGSIEIDGKTLDAPIGAVLRAHTPVTVSAGPNGTQAIILQGRPIDEPVAMGGPFVMNTQQEIQQAYRYYHATGFGGWPWTTTEPVHPRSTPRFARRLDGATEYPEGNHR